MCCKILVLESIFSHLNVLRLRQDQLRAEDLENEGATGRKPSYVVNDEGQWLTFGHETCYEGDSDEIVEGTVLKNPKFSHGAEGSVDLPPFLSSDLVVSFDIHSIVLFCRQPSILGSILILTLLAFSKCKTGRVYKCVLHYCSGQFRIGLDLLLQCMNE